VRTDNNVKSAQRCIQVSKSFPVAFAFWQKVCVGFSCPWSEIDREGMTVAQARSGRIEAEPVPGWVLSRLFG
jgi:hypothetical protein